MSVPQTISYFYIKLNYDRSHLNTVTYSGCVSAATMSVSSELQVNEWRRISECFWSPVLSPSTTLLFKACRNSQVGMLLKAGNIVKQGLTLIATGLASTAWDSLADIIEIGALAKLSLSCWLTGVERSLVGVPEVGRAGGVGVAWLDTPDSRASIESEV